MEEFAQSVDAKRVVAMIRAIATKRWTIMEISGTHTQTILQYGIDRLLSDNVEIVHGPGCAICITPLEIIDRAFAISRFQDVTFCVFGELLRVPGTRNDLLDAMATGADVQVVYDPRDCVRMAEEAPERKVVYFSVGAEKLLPACAESLLAARKLGLKNYFVLSAQAHMTPICSAVLRRHVGQVNAVLAPVTSCSVIGFKEYEAVSREFNVPVVVSGIEPADVLEGIYKCISQLESGKAQVENQCAGYVSRQGNAEQQELINQSFVLMDFQWRRLGTIKESGFQLRQELDHYNAWIQFPVEAQPVHESPVCISEEIMLGLKKPCHCPAFGPQLRAAAPGRCHHGGAGRHLRALP